jgi:hypothetical protein
MLTQDPLNTAGLLYVTQPALGKSEGQFVSAAIGARSPA